MDAADERITKLEEEADRAAAEHAAAAAEAAAALQAAQQRHAALQAERDAQLAAAQVSFRPTFANVSRSVSNPISTHVWVILHAVCNETAHTLLCALGLYASQHGLPTAQTCLGL